MDETILTTLEIIFSIAFWTWIIWRMKRSGWRPLVWVVAVVAVRRIVFYAKWIAYSRHVDKISEFIAKADLSLS